MMLYKLVFFNLGTKDHVLHCELSFTLKLVYHLTLFLFIFVFHDIDFFFFLRVQTSCIIKLDLSDCFLVASFRFNFFGKNTIEVVVRPQGITSGGPKLFVLLLVM